MELAVEVALTMTSLEERAHRWIVGDPDPVTRAQLQRALDTNDEHVIGSLMGEPLAFGTAGIRGEVGAGPARMNRAVVIKTTWGLARYLDDEVGSGTVVVGFDARPSSRMFSEDTVGVLLAAGYQVAYLAEPAPTPLVAFAAKTLEAIAAVVVTASHNPPQDNGYKVYGPLASQIVSPVDTIIQRHLIAAPAAVEIARDPASSAERLGGDMVDLYRDEVLKTRSRQVGSDLNIVYTPIHGVGWQTFNHVMTAAGHTRLTPVPEQVEPDGTFPTVSFPNPEEPGALDLALELGTKTSADLVVANDPDADRLAVVVPTTSGWRPLSGNEIGVLLGDYLLSNYSGRAPAIVASSIVSSPMFGLVASAHDAVFERTLTGFKWIMAAGLAREESGDGQFLYGYEEALGFSVGRTVRDKDGISAALLFTDLAADLIDERMTILEDLARLWRRHGLWVSSQKSIVRDGPGGVESLVAAVDGLAASPPSILRAFEVTEVIDYRVDAETRPSWLGQQNLVEMILGDNGRVLVRPSGTEPKLKIYVDLSRALDSSDVETQRLAVQLVSNEIGEELAAFLNL